MRSKIIGIFDSGVGGLSVLARAAQVMPDVDFIYYADTEHVPYGTKSRAEIIHYSLEATDFLIKNGAEAILVACNTATSMAVDTLRATYSVIPIVGMEPAVKPAVTLHPHERILVCATPATIHGQKLHELLERTADSDSNVELAALPGLVTYAENGFFDTDAVSEYIISQVSRTDYTACVLGCTHFSYFRDSMHIAFPKAELIDGTEGTVHRLCYVTENEYNSRSNCNSNIRKGSISYYRTGVEITDSITLELYEMLQKRAMSIL